MIDIEALADALPEYLPRQRWFSSRDSGVRTVEIAESEWLRPEWPALLWLLADAHLVNGAVHRYQMVLGARPTPAEERFLEGKQRLTVGTVPVAGTGSAGGGGEAVVYDALVDQDLAVALLGVIAPEEGVARIRPLNVEQTNTSVVYDERLILKLFRRVHDGPNPDAEVTRALADHGFAHISAPVADWRRNGVDLAVVREYLTAGTDGFVLAQTSLRDLYDSRLDPADAGGDFAPEARRLGEIAASMHLALAAEFGVEPAAASEIVTDMRAQLDRVGGADIDHEAVDVVYAELAEADDMGSRIRLHGDLHLGQTMRTDDGWYVLDFEGEPDRPLEERRRPASPLRDVAGMLRSFHYAAQVTLRERDEHDADLAQLARRWDDRASRAFVDGYRCVDGVDDLLPGDEVAVARLLNAYELDKAVYEVAYETAHRPAWVPIPQAAVQRVLARESRRI